MEPLLPFQGVGGLLGGKVIASKRVPCPHCAAGAFVATTCLECNRRFFEAADMTMIRERSKWLMRYHPEVASEIRAMWKQMWRAR